MNSPRSTAAPQLAQHIDEVDAISSTAGFVQRLALFWINILDADCDFEIIVDSFYFLISFLGGSTVFGTKRVIFLAVEILT